MPSAAGKQSGSPIIAGATMSDTTFSGLPDDEVLSTGLFDFENSPDTLQTFGSANSAGSKMFISPSELQSTESLPDSPNGSTQDSSSESASSVKRSGSTTSPHNMGGAGEMALGSDIGSAMDWDAADFPEHVHDHTYDTFSFGHSATSPNVEDVYSFGADDSFLNSSFDISGTDDGLTSGAVTAMPSPGMPTIESDSPARSKPTSTKKAAAKPKRPRQKTQHTPVPLPTPAQASSATTPTASIKTAGSRDTSPMQHVTASDISGQAMAGQSPQAQQSQQAQQQLQRQQTQQQQQAQTQQNGMPDYSAMVANGQNAWMPNMNQFPMTRELPFHAGMNGHPGMLPPHLNRYYNHSPYPPGYFFSNGPYELMVHTRPVKSRVETQIPITMVLNPLPPGIRRLHLPTHKISKPKLLAKPPVVESPDMLELHVSLVCTSAMDKPELQEKAFKQAREVPHKYLPPEDSERKPQEGEEVYICKGCMMRERKRAGRKKIKHVADELMWTQDEAHRAIVFNTKEVQVWEPLENLFDSEMGTDTGLPRGTMQCSIPLRIACYCRHHGEKNGFKVIFTIKDWEGNCIAQTMSRSIMITDDHKTHAVDKVKTLSAGSKRALPDQIAAASITSANAPPAGYNPAPPVPQAITQTPVPVPNPGLNAMTQSMPASFQSSPQPMHTNRSRPPSVPNSPGHGGPSAKKRKSSGSSSRVPNDLTMTRLETSVSPGATGPGSQISTAASPFSPNLNAFPTGEQLFAQAGPMTTGPPTPNNNDQIPFFGSHRSGSMDNLAMAQLYSAPTSNHASRAPSPNGLRNAMNGAASQPQLGQAVSNSLNNLYTMPMNMNQSRPPPTIHKIVPAEGSTSGGIDVTILGSSFFSGLEVWFGEQKATTTTYWGEPSLVCLLPPSAVSGIVPVILKNQAGQIVQTLGRTPPMFRYIDDNEDKLIRTALSVLGHKMSGQMMDVSELARRILNDSGGSQWGGNGSGGQQSAGGGPAFNQASREHLESQLLKVLDLIDLDDSPHRTCLDLKSDTGHTMLHLAASLGYHRFVAALLARGANPNARDVGGYTPLHMAAMRDHPEIVRRLMLAGASSSARSLNRQRVADVAKSRGVLKAIQRSSRHSRSRSGGSLHSRASSTSSLRSLWEPMSKVRTHDEPIAADSSEESPEYSTSDYEDEDSDDSHEMLTMRRPSGFSQETPPPIAENMDNGLPSPATNAMTAALKEHFQQQFQQFQQSMALHFQNLPHLPHLPQMPQMPQMPNFPNMPVMPDYQAYIQQRPFIQRMTQMMPGKSLTGSRPGSHDSDSEDSGSGSDSPKVDNNKWWPLSSYKSSPTNGASVAPPPAYDEIFPGGSSEQKDVKTLSAAQAATEAAADEKCAALFDQETTTTTAEVDTIEEVGESSEVNASKVEVPSILKIGRKNAITKEQQDQFLQAQKEKYKRLSNDRNLFFIWIPLLVMMVCAMLYNYFPSLFAAGFSYGLSTLNKGFTQANRFLSELEDRAAAAVQTNTNHIVT